jgi:hypothetical protein
VKSGRFVMFVFGFAGFLVQRTALFVRLAFARRLAAIARGWRARIFFAIALFRRWRLGATRFAVTVNLGLRGRVGRSATAGWDIRRYGACCGLSFRFIDRRR